MVTYLWVILYNPTRYAIPHVVWNIRQSVVCVWQMLSFDWKPVPWSANWSARPELFTESNNCCECRKKVELQSLKASCISLFIFWSDYKKCIYLVKSRPGRCCFMLKWLAGWIDEEDRSIWRQEHLAYIKPYLYLHIFVWRRE